MNLSLATFTEMVRKPRCRKCKFFRVEHRGDTLCRNCQRRAEEPRRKAECWGMVADQIQERALDIHAQAFVYDVLTGYETVDEIMHTLALARAQQTAGVFEQLPYTWYPLLAKNLIDTHRHRQVMWFPQRGYTEDPVRVPLPDQSRTTRVTLVSFNVRPPTVTQGEWGQRYPHGSVLIQGQPWTGSRCATLYAIPGDWEIYLKEDKDKEQQA